MPLKPWYKIVTPREDLREGKPLDASEFAVHLDQVREGRAPADYQKPERFFERTSDEEFRGDQDPVKVEFDPLELLQYIKVDFAPMNAMCERAEMFEERIKERTRALFDYFGFATEIKTI